MSYKESNLRIGIIGGTFDPIHFAHLIAAETVSDALKLDEIWFIPNQIPPHKLNKNITEGKHRIRMLELATLPYPEFKVNLIEFEREEISYTFDTIYQLKERHPKYLFYFIIGADMVEYLPNWYRFEDLMNMVQFVALKRPNYTIEPHHSWLQQMLFVDMPQIEISSSMIRSRCLVGESIRFLVPDAVRSYIKENNLYV